jgi:hypothetical protein
VIPSKQLTKESSLVSVAGKMPALLRSVISFVEIALEDQTSTNIFNDKIFHKDGMTPLYGQEIVGHLNAQWTQEKIKVILNLIEFLNGDTMAEDNVKSLENIVNNIDKSTQKILD